MRVEVSHESPISLLRQSRKYNDYDYALVHLFEAYPEYFEFFVESMSMGRKVYLDNSIFELKKSFDPEKYVEWIDKLRPTYYIVPDVLEDADGTVRQMMEWFDNTCNKSSVKKECGTIGVVQGRDWDDLVRCYRVVEQMVDIVAISFDYDYYLLTGDGTGQANVNWGEVIYGEEDPLSGASPDPMSCTVCVDKLNRYKTGRQRFISQLINEGIWNWKKPHHLLGCSLASEFGYYTNNNIYNIVTIDTSNPIVAGLKGIRYNDTMGLPGKPRTLLADMIDFKVSEDELPRYMKDIEYNTKMFKKIIGRHDG
jgi:hypothetical protein